MSLLPSVVGRFWPKVVKTGCCWIWRGARDPGGYGRMFCGRRGGSPLKAHRVSWELVNGPIPDGLGVLHDCPCGDNPSCVNPGHLWLGTDADNNRDMAAKGRARGSRGEANRKARLTAVDVAAIRFARSLAGAKGTDIARAYGVTSTAIYSVFKGETWNYPSTRRAS